MDLDRKVVNHLNGQVANAGEKSYRRPM